MVADIIGMHAVTSEDPSLLQEFLADAGSSLASFRYYSSRPFSVIKNHLVTIVMTENGKAIGYGHLDKDGDTVWLGIAVSEQSKGKGFGSRIMQYLVSAGEEFGLKQIHLTVDNDNATAIRLYERFGFVKDKMINDQSLKMIKSF
jgi:ribosomal protein S18 acetylase RimI-like enzyme